MGVVAVGLSCIGLGYTPHESWCTGVKIVDFWTFRENMMYDKENRKTPILANFGGFWGGPRGGVFGPFWGGILGVQTEPPGGAPGGAPRGGEKVHISEGI